MPNVNSSKWVLFDVFQQYDPLVELLVGWLLFKINDFYS